MSTGALGVAIYLGLLAWIGSRASRSREPMPMAMLISVVMVSIFGYVLRQPDYWMVLVLALILSDQASMVRRPQAGLGVLEPDVRAWQPTARYTSRFEQNRLR
jgi:hypothetical protein